MWNAGSTDGVTFNRDDTASRAFAKRRNADGTIDYLDAPAAVNPITWTIRLKIDVTLPSWNFRVPTLDFTAGAAVRIGTTDAFDLILKRAGADKVTIQPTSVLFVDGLISAAGIYDSGAATDLVLRRGGVNKATFGAALATFVDPIVLPANPTTALQAATKQYADLMLPLVGGVSMTGLFNLSGDPSATLHPATKQYVDNAAKAKIATGSGGGDYSTTSATYVDVDAANLSPSLTAPTGYTILAVMTARVNTPVDGSFLALVDGAGAVRDEIAVAGGLNENVALLAQVGGNGAAQAFKLQFRSVTATQITAIVNSSVTLRPVIHLIYAKTGS